MFNFFINFFKNHLVLSAIGAVCVFLLWTLPAWLGSVWPLFSTKTIPQWVSERRWLGMTPDFFIWFTVSVGIVVIVMLGMILYTVHQQRKEERQSTSLRSTVAELQATLTKIRDTQPRLIAKPELFQRTIDSAQQPGILKEGFLFKSYRGGYGCFALLRITNAPESLNTSALARNLSVIISYCDEHWDQLPAFPEMKGLYFSPNHSEKPRVIGNILSIDNPTLMPQKWIYVGIALRYPWGDQLQCYALNTYSPQYADWLHPELKLPSETTSVEVTASCNGFRETYRYVLRDCGPEKGLLLEEFKEPTSLSSGTS